jgi:hypothetical protein
MLARLLAPIRADQGEKWIGWETTKANPCIMKSPEFVTRHCGQVLVVLEVPDLRAKVAKLAVADITAIIHFRDL